MAGSGFRRRSSPETTMPSKPARNGISLLRQGEFGAGEIRDAVIRHARLAQALQQDDMVLEHA